VDNVRSTRQMIVDTYSQEALDEELLSAAGNGIIENVRLFLDAGANVDAEDHIKQTPLHRAARNGHTEVAKLLILNGADPFKAFDDPNVMIKFFNGDISWMPEELKAKVERRVRSRGAFGRF